MSRSTPPVDEGKGTFGLLADALRRRWVMALVAVLVTPVLAVVATSFLPKRYKSSAKVMVQDGKTTNPLLNDLMVQWSVKSRIDLAQNVLQSHSTLEQVLRRIGELPASAPPAKVNSEVESFRKDIEMVGMAGGIVLLKVSRGAPEGAQRTAEVLVETFITEMLRPQKQAIAESTEFLKEQLERLRNELEAQERALADFKREHAGELPEVFHNNLEVQFGVQRQLLEAQLALSAAERQKKVLEERLRSQSPALRQIEQKLQEATFRLHDMRAGYTDHHPVLVAQQALVDRLDRERTEAAKQSTDINLGRLEALAAAQGPSERRAAGVPASADALMGDIVGYKAVLVEIEGARGRIAMLNKRLGEAETAVKGFAELELKLTELLRERDTKAKIYRDLLAKYQDALVTRELAIFDEKGQVWIIEPPTRPVTSSRPPLAIVAAGGLFAGLVLAAALVAVADAYTGVLRRSRVRVIAGADVVGALRPRNVA